MTSHSTLPQVIAPVIATSDNSQLHGPNIANPSRIGTIGATNPPCSAAFQRTLDAFLLKPAGRAAATCSGTRSAAQIAMADLRHEGKSPEKACTPHPPLPGKVTYRRSISER